MMRSNNLKRHMRKHRDIYSLDEETLRDEIKDRKRKYEDREKRKQLVLEIAEQEQVPLQCCVPSTTKLHTSTLCQDMLQNINVYYNSLLMFI